MSNTPKSDIGPRISDLDARIREWFHTRRKDRP